MVFGRDRTSLEWLLGTEEYMHLGRHGSSPGTGPGPGQRFYWWCKLAKESEEMHAGIDWPAKAREFIASGLKPTEDWQFPLHKMATAISIWRLTP